MDGLKRYEPACRYSEAVMVEQPNGDYVVFDDVQAYTQAAIAQAMVTAVAGLDHEPNDPDDDEYDVVVRYKHGFNDGLDWAKGIIEQSIPPDAMAALGTILAEAEQRGFDRAKEQAAQKVHSFLAYLRAGEAPLTFDLAAAIRAIKGIE